MWRLGEQLFALIIKTCSWSRASYSCTLGATPFQAVFIIYMIFNLASIVDWRVITARNHLQVEINNVLKNSKRVRFDYTMGNLVYLYKTCIYRKIYYNKYGPYIIKQFFKNGTVWVQRFQVNKEIYILQLGTHFRWSGIP